MRGQEVVLLLVGAVADDVRPTLAIRGPVEADGSAGGQQFLDQHVAFEGSPFVAAVLFRPGHADPTAFGHLAAECLVVVAAVAEGGAVLVQERADFLAEGFRCRWEFDGVEAECLERHRARPFQRAAGTIAHGVRVGQPWGFRRSLRESLVARWVRLVGRGCAVHAQRWPGFRCGAAGGRRGGPTRGTPQREGRLARRVGKACCAGFGLVGAALCRVVWRDRPAGSGGAVTGQLRCRRGCRARAGTVWCRRRWRAPGRAGAGGSRAWAAGGRGSGSVRRGGD